MWDATMCEGEGVQRIAKVLTLFMVAILVGPKMTGAAAPVDTLDWRGFYPLEIGNVWEYEARNEEGRYVYDRFEIVADSVVAGSSYFVQVESTYDRRDIEVRERDTLLLRYDEDLVTVVQLDSTASEHMFDFWGTLRLCDLAVRSDPCPTGEFVVMDSSSVRGYHLGWFFRETFLSGGYKLIRNEQYAAHLLHGLGITSWECPGPSDCPSMTLQYAQIAGSEYGSSFIELRTKKDTLDWHGYFPLEVGNTWELSRFWPGGGSGNFHILRFEIVREFTVLGTAQYEMVEQHWRWSPDFSEHYVLDREASHLVNYDEGARTVANFPLLPFPCDMQADFNAPAPSCRDGSTSGGTDGHVTIGNERVDVRAVKRFSGGFGTYSVTLAHGLGLTGYYENEVYQIEYVAVGGREYGESRLERIGRTHTEDETPSTAAALSSIAPNPVAQSATISFTAKGGDHVRIEIFDMLGRRVGIVTDQMYSPGRHDVDWEAGDLSSGIHMVRLTAGSSTSSRKVVVLR